MVDHDLQLPYRAGYANLKFRGFRAGCRECEVKFLRDELCLAKMVESCVTDQFKVPKWYHVVCFFERHDSPERVEDITFFETLRLADQDSIIKRIVHYLRAARRNIGAFISATKANPNFHKFEIDYSKNNRYRCDVCKKKIMQEDLRVSKFIRTSNDTHLPEDTSPTYHLYCFAEERRVLKFQCSGALLAGIGMLKEADQIKCKRALPAIDQRSEEERSGNLIIKPKIIGEDDSNRRKNEEDRRPRHRVVEPPPAADKIEDKSSETKMVSVNITQVFVSAKRDHHLARQMATTRSSLKQYTRKINFAIDSSSKSLYSNNRQRSEERKTDLRAGDDDGDPVPSSFGEREAPTKAKSRAVLTGEFEVAKNSRATCKGCQQKILCNEMRIFRKEPQKSWYHEQCFATKTLVPPFRGSQDTKLVGGRVFGSKQDRMSVKNTFPKIKSSDWDKKLVKPWKSQTPEIVEDDRDVYTFCDQPETPPKSFGSMRTRKSDEDSSTKSSKVEEDEFCDQSKISPPENDSDAGFQTTDAQEASNETSEKSDLDDASAPINLDESVRSLVRLLFNRDLLENAMEKMEIDSKLMPLDEVNRERIEKGSVVLKKLQDKMSRRGEQKIDKELVGKCSNEFYSLIPSNKFEASEAPPLSTLSEIQKKARILDSLMGIEVAYSLLSLDESTGGGCDEDPADESSTSDKSDPSVNWYYEKLHANIRTMKETKPEFEMLKLCVRNANNSKDINYKLEVINIYEVERQGERERYAPFSKWDNRYLLWHGSRLTNFAGILSQGLRIAPGEAPSSGYTFGNGIYFADLVSKAAKHCEASASKDIGLLLVCEVALGKIQTWSKSEPQLTQPGKGYNSVKGLGRTIPHVCKTQLLRNGAQIEAGGEVVFLASASIAPFSYNEYVVYDEAQIKMRYLIQVQFNFVAAKKTNSTSSDPK